MSLYACKAGNFYGDEIIARRAILHMGMLFSDGKISIKLPKLPHSSKTKRGVIMACTCVLIKNCWESFQVSLFSAYATIFQAITDEIKN